jgi:outer membrane murein-binding lipoprotein Lpp
MLNNITENKQQMVHIIAELLIMGGIVYYFNQKHKKIISEIQELNDKLDKKENDMNKIIETINSLVDIVVELKQNNSNINTKVLEQQLLQQKGIQKRAEQLKEMEDRIKQKQLLLNNQKDQKPDKIVQDYNDKIKIDTIKNPLVTPVENSKNIKVKNAVKNEVKKEVKNEVKNEDEEKRELDQELENELLELEESEDIIEVDTRDLKQNHL